MSGIRKNFQQKGSEVTQMPYDKLIKRLRETSVYFGESDDVSVMMIEAANAIEELQVVVDGLTAQTNMVFEKTEGRTVIKFEPKWIPVTERLPDDGAEVLAFSISGFAYVDWWIDGKWKVNSMVDGKYEFVTHWMPLPQPPERDGE